MIESKDIVFRSTVVSASIDRTNSFRNCGDQNETFDRSASFMDIARQTSENDFSIKLYQTDTIMNKISPPLSKRMVKVTLFVSSEVFI